MVDTSKQTDPPLVDVKVTNPIEYIKIWWNRIIGNEGVDFSFHIKPLTAIAISVVIASIGFGLGRFAIPAINLPFLKLNAYPSPSPTPTSSNELWKETAFTGTLQYTNATNRYFLITTSSSEAITLEVPKNIDLNELIGKRIFAAGNYNKSTRILVVFDTKSLEVLPKSPIPVPTLTPTPTPSPEITPVVSPTVEPVSGSY
jgi:hypothetical protein